MTARLITLVIIGALEATAQAPPGTIRVTVIDSLTHQPVRKAEVVLNGLGRGPVNNGTALNRNQTTDSNGNATFDGMPAAIYVVSAAHRNYAVPVRQKSLTLAAGETANVTLSLTAGASVSGHVLDEDGDPVAGCSVQAVRASGFGATPRTTRLGSRASVGPGGEYRLSGLSPGEYLLLARCNSPVFEPRPLSPGPPPPPSLAWAPVYYPSAHDATSAQAVALDAGADRTETDFRISPRPVTHIHVTLTPSGENIPNLNWLLTGSEDFQPTWRSARPVDGAFDIPGVFAGTYMLLVEGGAILRSGDTVVVSGPRVSQPNNVQRSAYAQVTVGDTPVPVHLELRDAVVLSGHVEMEDGAALTPPPDTQPGHSVNVLFMGDYPQFPRANAWVKGDGTFSLQLGFPGHLAIEAPNAFIKSVSLAGRDLPDRAVDPQSAAGELRIILSNHTAAVQGTAPAGMSVAVVPAGNDDIRTWGGRADENGRFHIESLPPGDYRIGVSDTMPFIAEDDGQAITLHEGETLNLELKPPDDSAPQ